MEAVKSGSSDGVADSPVVLPTLSNDDGKKELINYTGAQLKGGMRSCLGATTASDIPPDTAKMLVNVLRVWAANENREWWNSNTPIADAILRSVSKLAVALPGLDLWGDGGRLLDSLNQILQCDKIFANIASDIPQDVLLHTDDPSVGGVPASVLLLVRAAPDYWSARLSGGMMDAADFSKSYPRNPDASPAIVKVVGVSRAALELYVASIALGAGEIDSEATAETLMDLLAYAHNIHQGKIPEHLLAKYGAMIVDKIDANNALDIYKNAAHLEIGGFEQPVVECLIKASPSIAQLVELIEALESEHLETLAENILARAEIAAGDYNALTAGQLYDLFVKYGSGDSAEVLAPSILGDMESEALLAALESGELCETEVALLPQHVKDASADKLLAQVNAWCARAGHGNGYKLVEDADTNTWRVQLRKGRFKAQRSDEAQNAADNINRFLAQLSTLTRVNVDALPHASEALRAHIREHFLSLHS